jgi:hypothetical protein
MEWEMKILTQEAFDQIQYDLYNKPNTDLHRHAAAWMFDTTPEAVTLEQRAAAKSQVYRFIYGVPLDLRHLPFHYRIEAIDPEPAPAAYTPKASPWFCN